MVLLALVAWELTESFTLSGVLMASSAIPMIIFTLPGGAIADRVGAEPPPACDSGAWLPAASPARCLVHRHLFLLS